MFEAEDEVAFKRNVMLMKQELAKSKPQTGNVTSLMGRTFSGRRQWILDEIRGVDEICEEYPCLSKSTFVSHVAFLCVCLVGVDRLYLSV